MTEKPRIHVDSKSDLEKLKDLGTTYYRGERTTVATTVGTGDKEVVFILEKD